MSLLVLVLFAVSSACAATALEQPSVGTTEEIVAEANATALKHALKDVVFWTQKEKPSALDEEAQCEADSPARTNDNTNELTPTPLDATTMGACLIIAKVDKDAYKGFGKVDLAASYADHFQDGCSTIAGVVFWKDSPYDETPHSQPWNNLNLPSEHAANATQDEFKPLPGPPLNPANTSEDCKRAGQQLYFKFKSFEEKPANADDVPEGCNVKDDGTVYWKPSIILNATNVDILDATTVDECRNMAKDMVRKDTSIDFRKVDLDAPHARYIQDGCSTLRDANVVFWKPSA